MDKTIELTAGPLRLVVDPAVGGSISAFEWHDGSERWPILRRCPDPLEQVLDAASFPLVPYVNRIRDGRFTFRGREVRLQPNMAGDPSPLHGQGWLNPWEIEEQTDTSATLSFRHEAGEWPWAYEARQKFKLTKNGLWLELTCRNLSGEPMPCGLGLHPYYPCGSHTVLDTEVKVAWTIDDKVLPVERVPATGRYDLRERHICSQDLDNGFGEWSGQARISDPTWPFKITMTAPLPDTRFFQVYSPRAGGVFVAEPVTHANAALNEPEENWSDLGIELLEPGEAAGIAIQFDVIPHEASG